LKVLEAGKIRETVISAVEAATKRSKELSGGK
jgi:pyrroline-5-carboxylate reductase